MFFYLRNRNKSIKELRKNISLTSKELAVRTKIRPSRLLSMDKMRFKDVPEEIRERLIPIFRGDHLDNYPW